MTSPPGWSTPCLLKDLFISLTIKYYNSLQDVILTKNKQIYCANVTITYPNFLKVCAHYNLKP